MRKVGLFFIGCLLIAFSAYAQKGKQKAKDEAIAPAPIIAPQDMDSLKKYELALKEISDSMVDGQRQYTRIKATIKFIPVFVKALKIKGSIYYPFDSLKFMKKLSPPDKSFRLYNWTLKYDDGSYRYYGSIQMNTNDGKLKMFPLRDYREKMDTNMEQVVVGPDEWIGALYYDLIPEKVKGKEYYTLLAWDGNVYLTKKKVIEVLSFDKEGKPVFGAPIFDVKGVIKDRIIFQFSGNANMLLQYVPDHNMITFDKLVPPNPANEGFLYTYVPDGTYDYFIWKKNKWLFQEELFENFKKPIKEAGE
jgi:hypothetical protein